jgi:hypothetical protein
MVNLADAILVLVPAATFGPGGTVALADRGDGTGPAVVAWDAALGPQPTPDQLAKVTPAQVTAYYQQQAQAAALALLTDPGATGTALRAVYLAAGLTAAQVQAQLPAASGQKG